MTEGVAREDFDRGLSVLSGLTWEAEHMYVLTLPNKNQTCSLQKLFWLQRSDETCSQTCDLST